MDAKKRHTLLGSILAPQKGVVFDTINVAFLISPYLVATTPPFSGIFSVDSIFMHLLCTFLVTKFQYHWRVRC